MIAPADIRVPLQTAIKAVLDARVYTLQQWDNVDVEPVPGTKWARVWFDPLVPVRETMTGTPAGGLTYEGAVNIDVFTPQNTGPAEAEATFHAIQQALTEARFCLQAGVLELDPLVMIDSVATAPWWMLTMRVDFRIFNVPG